MHDFNNVILKVAEFWGKIIRSLEINSISEKIELNDIICTKLFQFY